MCGAAVSEMVSCMSKKLHLGAKCEANCGAGKDFVSASCTAKMAKCGYKRAHPGSPDCARPGAVTAFLRSPTPRGRFWGHVQFGCGDRFCSSYKTPIEKSWPHGKTPDVCYILESKEIQNTESQIAEVKPTELPRFDFGGHPLPTNHSCRNCSKLAELIQRYEKADTDEKMEIALEVAEVIRKTAADVDQRSPEAQRLEVKAAMIASLAVSDGDFDAATTYRLMGVCAKNPDSFNDVFEDFEPIEQAGIAEKMKTYQKYNKMGLGCKIPEAGEN